MFERAMKRAPKRDHEIGNIYLKTLVGLPKQIWQEWKLVKFIDFFDNQPHAVMQELDGKTTRTVAIAALNDPNLWAMRDEA
jgi:hypothetical protein